MWVAVALAGLITAALVPACRSHAPRPDPPGPRRGLGLLIAGTLEYGLPAVLLGAVCLGSAALAGGQGPPVRDAAAAAGAFTAGVLCHPLRARLRRAADRMLRAERNPYRLADRLSRTVQRARGPVEALDGAVALIRRTLHVPGASVEIIGAAGEPTVHRDGELGDRPYEVPLTWQGEPVGRMLVARPAGRLRRLDARLLGILAVHMADVAHGVRLAADLQRSRERIVAAREEERRRLRRELHDGLGPTLASLAMSVDVARLTIARTPARVEPLLCELRRRLDAAIGDIRDLVEGLRPPALDDLGLEGALRALADRCGPVAVQVDLRGEVADLPAAVEVAAYRIVQEALANVVRHSRAAAAWVCLSRTPDALQVTVSDSGSGLPEPLQVGGGLRSMRERAAEVGGDLTVASRRGGGTTVRARLPLAVASEDPPSSGPFRHREERRRGEVSMA
ncbi:MAG: two-component sensor histidine kinase [Thermomonospora sp. CIF 1]|nr:MAG: two-component sensor histidine kinase [Thermomonospora sp. CIF 1]